MERQFTWGVRTGNPIALPGGSATPRAFAVAARLGPMAFTWNTPVGMEIARADGAHERVQIVDVTRWALWGLAALAMMTGARAARNELARRVRYG